MANTILAKYQQEMKNVICDEFGRLKIQNVDISADIQAKNAR